MDMTLFYFFIQVELLHAEGSEVKKKKRRVYILPDNYPLPFSAATGLRVYAFMLMGCPITQ